MSSFDNGTSPSRADRNEPAAPPCPTCRSSSDVTTPNGRDAASYWRCGKCGEVWNVSRHQKRLDVDSSRSLGAVGAAARYRDAWKP